MGNDLSAIQPPWVPPNVKFEIDDVECPWVYEAPFDFIFCRYMAAAILDWPALVQNVYKCVIRPHLDGLRFEWVWNES